MPTKEDLIIRYLCGELLRREIITQETANHVLAKFAKEKGQNACYKKTA